MPDPLRLLAFAAPDTSELGVELGGTRLAGPDAQAAFAVAESFGDRHEPLLAAEHDGVGLVAGTIARPGDGESLRLAIAMFPAGRILALTALRPRKAKGHDRDIIDAVVLEDGVLHPVEDPRVSVTLDGGGSPRRIGLELWLAAPSGDGDEPPPPDFPRRAAGEVAAWPPAMSGDGMQTRIAPVRWRSRGEDGVGWFILAEPA